MLQSILPISSNRRGPGRLLLLFGFELLLGLLLLMPEWEWAAPFGRPLIELTLLTPLGPLDLIGMAAWAMAVGTVWEWWRIGRPRPAFGPFGVSLPLLVLTLLLLAGSLGALDRAAALAQARSVGAALLLFLLVRNSAALRHLLPPLLLAIGLAQAAVAVGQFGLQRALGLDAFGEIAIRDPGLSGAFVLLDGAGHRWLRAYGLTGHPNILGGELAAWLLLALGLCSLKGQRDRSNPSSAALPQRLAWRLGLVLLAAGLTLSFSRGAWLALATGLIATGLAARRQSWSGPDRRRLLLNGLLIGATFATLLIPLRELLSGRLDPNANPLEGRSLAERAVEWRLAPALVADRPWLGVGGGNYTLTARAWHQPLLVESPVQPAHNLLLLITAETGLAGGLAWLVLMLQPIRSLLATQATPLELATALALIALFVAGLFDHYLWDRFQGLALLAVLLGLWSATHERRVQWAP